MHDISAGCHTTKYTNLLSHAVNDTHGILYTSHFDTEYVCLNNLWVFFLDAAFCGKEAHVFDRPQHLH